MRKFTGHHVGGYILEEEIEQGSRGIVYRGTQVALEREVAIKLFPHQWSPDPGAVARFVREAQILARLNHPHLVQIYDAGQQGDLLYFVMEYVPGPTIRSLLMLDGTFPQHLAVEYIAQAAEALDVAYHEARVLHRNLTSDNLKLDWWGRIKIMDFGLASVPDLPPITEMSTLIGSLALASPEQLQGHVPDHRSDIYALGLILYEMLTGTFPFMGHTPQEVTQAILTSSPPSPRLFAPELSPDLEHILFTMLARDRDARFAESGTIARALRALPSSIMTSGARHEPDKTLCPRPEEHSSSWMPKRLTLPMREMYTPVPGMLTPLPDGDRQNYQTCVSSIGDQFRISPNAAWQPVMGC